MYTNLTNIFHDDYSKVLKFYYIYAFYDILIKILINYNFSYGYRLILRLWMNNSGVFFHPHTTVINVFVHTNFIKFAFVPR